MEFSAFVTSLASSFVIFLILMLVFTWLSRKPWNAVIYYPNRIVKGLDPYEVRKKSRSPFSWIQEALSASEADIIAISGVDAAVYFVFLSTVMGILLLSGVVLLPILLPVSATDKIGIKSSQRTSNGTFNSLDRLSMASVKVASPRLWAFLLATYWVSFVTYYLLWKAYRHVTEIRAAALSSPDVKPEQFTVLVRDIPPVPPGTTREEQVDLYFRTINPESFYKSMVVTKINEANKIWKKMVKYKKKLERAEAIYAASKTVNNPEGIRPTNKTGLLGLIGKKVDTIDHCNNKMTELQSQLEAEQKTTLSEKQQNSALVFFNSRKVTAYAAQAIYAKRLDTWRVTEAPGPREVIWNNLAIKFYSRMIRQNVVYAIVALTIFFYLIPISFVSAFTTLENLRRLFPFLKSVLNLKQVRTVLEAYLPQIVLLLFLALLPKFLMILSKAEGIPSMSHVIRASSGKYFYFTVLNVFIGVTIGGTLFTTLKSIQEKPNSFVILLGRSLPSNATFFLTFVALRVFVGYGLELSRLVPLIIYHIKKKCLCKTETEVKEAWAPGDIHYATRVPADMLIITIVLCYSVIAPIIIPFGVIYFGLGWLVLRNQALKVYIPMYESYGRMWPHIHTRIVAALIIYQFTMLGYFGVKKFLYTPFLTPLPVMSFVFAYLARKKFYHSFQFTALELLSDDGKDVPNMEAIYKSYIPPCLSLDKFDDVDKSAGDPSRFVQRIIEGVV